MQRGSGKERGRGKGVWERFLCGGGGGGGVVPGMETMEQPEDRAARQSGRSTLTVGREIYVVLFFNNLWRGTLSVRPLGKRCVFVLKKNTPMLRGVL